MTRYSPTTAFRNSLILGVLVSLALVALVLMTFGVRP